MILTAADEKLLPLARRENKGFHLATEWYFRGMIPLPYQYAWHMATQMNTTVLAGIAAGKTFSEAASICIDCLSIPYFRALCTSVTAKQAELPFDMFMSWYEGNERLEHLIEDIKLRPWPIVKFSNYSEWEFRTCGLDARFIRGSEYDRIGYDEAGLDNVGGSVKVLRGRLRGIRPNGQKRLARLDVLTSPTSALWLEDRFYKGVKGHAKEELEFYISMRARTRDNTNLTEKQILLMEAEYTDEMIDVEMNAQFPDYGMSMFPKSHIDACTSQAMYDHAYMSINPESGSAKKGFIIEEHPRHGITKFEMPYSHGIHVMAGDPGIDDPPRRNSGVVMVVDISKKPSPVVYFDWVAGHGSYMPFLDSYKYAIQKYKPAIKLLDTTGPQKMLQELAFEQYGIDTDRMNFSHDKDGALNSLSLAVTNHDLFWPPAKGLLRQMSTYTRENDKKAGFPQDITMTLAMLAFGMRYAPDPENEDEPLIEPFEYRRSRRNRSGRGRRR